MAQKKKRLTYFFMDGDLHKILKVNRSSNLASTWNYPQSKRVGYVWSDLRRNHGKAFTLTEVSKMIQRHRVNVENYILEGKIKKPQRTYSLDGTRKPGKYFFSEKDVFDLHDYLLTVHIGRPRKDGETTPGRMPSKLELRAMMRNDTTMYVKTESGEFMPIWKELEW